MLGWLADFFRLVWGLLYWNLRKTWFRRRRGRSPCPCQSPSDSGRAFKTRCDACIHWSKPKRFRRICPLLVETPEGLRCSVDAENVRPFWARAAGFYGGSFVAFYVIAVLGVFVALRTVGYPVSIFEVGLPPLWHRLEHARAWFFFEQANRAFAAGKSSEGLLYLANAYEFDPTNYQIGITLAKNYQVGQPSHSDAVFEQLMREHPDRRHATAQDWFRALLPRGNFEKIASLASAEIVADPPHAHGWIRALLFATRQMKDDQPLRDLRASLSPAVVPWWPLLETELLVRSGRTAEARTALGRPWPATDRSVNAFNLFYRVSTLASLGDTFGAVDLLERNASAIDEEARVTLLLDIYALRDAKNALQRETELQLAAKSSAPVVKILCAQLIRHPDPEIFRRLYAKMEREPLPLNSETAGIWFSLLCTAGVVGDYERLHDLTDRLKGATDKPFLALVLVEAFFRGRTSERRVTSILPFLPLPTEINYALIERYPNAPTSITASAGAKK